MNILQRPQEDAYKQKSRTNLEQHIREIRISKFKMSFIVKLQQGWAARVLVLQMEVMSFGLVGCVAALLANVYLEKNLIIVGNIN